MLRTLLTVSTLLKLVSGKPIIIIIIIIIRGIIIRGIRGSAA